ncbi:MAG: Gfo/Idh/MocA family oxidoreductase [Acidobacteriota bacterium]|nr:MAG: Gfo/Idh/MocA family oxidoreductase [Acidobacteriota bacterium]
MESINRRNFLKTASTGTAAMAATAPLVKSGLLAQSPNETINVAITGIRGRGWAHARNFCQIPNVKVVTLCDPDESLFAERVADVEERSGVRPKTETDLRRVLEDKDVDVVSIASQNHWHSLTSVWACQAGKDVYLEKPISHNIFEGRKAIEAARKYDRIVQTGTQRRSDPFFVSAMNYLHDGKLGDLYLIRLLILRSRDSIGRGKIVPIPTDVNFDLWLGPAPWRAFIDNRFHYNWHWFWDTGNGETGNNGPHVCDLARWALRKYDHPRKIQSVGGYFGFDCDQETPNTQNSTMQYADGSLVQLDVRNLYTNSETGESFGTLFYGTEGWMRVTEDKWETFYGRKNEPGPSMTREEAEAQLSEELNTRGRRDQPHFYNFIDAVRARDRRILRADVLEGHLSTSMCHLCNIAYRVGRTLEFDSERENFFGDDEANRLLSRAYRYPFVVPEEV